ncbi:MAG: rRNA maturation RNase YbeY [Eubacteriales bacterium]|nr:rRNA maturation RNase YbeY [Eubacteriales bacterium]
MVMNNRIPVHTEKRGLGVSLKTVRLIQGAVEAALLCEGMTLPCEVDVTLTDDEGIRRVNREQRGIDAATDVLSFPALSFHDGEGEPQATDFDPETGRLFLGDVVISVERARAQAEEYGHGMRRECGFLTVHSVLHLLGYDHVDDEERRRLMRAHEEQILAAMGLARESVQDSWPGLAKTPCRPASCEEERND